MVTLTGSILNENASGEDVTWIASTNLSGSAAGVSNVYAPTYIAYGSTYVGNIVEVVLLSVAAGTYPATLAFTYDTMNGRAAVTNAASFDVEILQTTPVPEPGTLGLALAGLLAVRVFARRAA